jgi:hypothetical protein
MGAGGKTRVRVHVGQRRCWFVGGHVHPSWRPDMSRLSHVSLYITLISEHSSFRIRPRPVAGDAGPESDTVGLAPAV